jgi:CRISPR-associated protein Csx10
MNGFLYTLTLLEPVLANSLGGEANSASSLFYVPGGLVRGAAINAYKGKKDAGDETFRCLFLDGRTRFLNAYPLVQQKRTLPSPLTWRTKRKPPSGEKKIIYNGFRDKIETEGAPFHYWFKNSEKLSGLEEEWQINVHTQRDAVRGRATTGAGAVYRYIALPAGMQLQGAILTDNKDDDAKIEKCLGGTILLGKARTAGYGHAHIELQPLPVDWPEIGEHTVAAATKFTLTLLSPALVRDANGQFSTDILPALEARIGQIKSIKAFCRQEIVGGFNRTWGLPLPQATAIAAGSVFYIEAVTEIPAETLRRLEETGIGERRAEGFGCVLVDFTFPEQMEYGEVRLELAGPDGGALPENDPTVRLMLTRLLRRDLDEQVIEAARNITGNYQKNKVPSSQISRWRVILRDTLSKQKDEDSIERMKKFCRDNQGKPGWEKMTKARVKIGDEQPRLTAWIETVLDHPEALAEAFGKGYLSKKSLGSNSIQTDEFNLEYRLRLLDAVLEIMAKKNSEGG